MPLFYLRPWLLLLMLPEVVQLLQVLLLLLLLLAAARLPAGAAHSTRRCCATSLRAVHQRECSFLRCHPPCTAPWSFQRRVPSGQRQQRQQQHGVRARGRMQLPPLEQQQLLPVLPRRQRQPTLPYATARRLQWQHRTCPCL